jgi:nitronate monooxygenase
MDFGSGGGSDSKAWKDIWGCGQGIGAVKDILPTAQLVERLTVEYELARKRIAAG